MQCRSLCRGRLAPNLQKKNKRREEQRSGDGAYVRPAQSSAIEGPFDQPKIRPLLGKNRIPSLQTQVGWSAL